LIRRVFAAAIRGLLVATLVAVPALVLPSDADTVEIAVLFSVFAGLLVFFEYNSDYPSLLDFRNAPPFNRIRFAGPFLTMLLLVVMTHGEQRPTGFSDVCRLVGLNLGVTLDFPFSPVRLLAFAQPQGTDLVDHFRLMTHAGMAILVSLVFLVVFVLVVRILNWPVRQGSFNFWVNLPLFDPTTGGDVIRRLKRDSHFNLALGVALPFLIPPILEAAVAMGFGPDLAEPQPLIWTVCIWAFVPTGLIMRGVALARIADLIAEKRRRAYAEAEEADMQTV